MLVHFFNDVQSSILKKTYSAVKSKVMYTTLIMLWFVIIKETQAPTIMVSGKSVVWDLVNCQCLQCTFVNIQKVPLIVANITHTYHSDCFILDFTQGSRENRSNDILIIHI